MMQFLGKLSASALAALVLTAGVAGAADVKPPKDFTAIHADNGTGEVLIEQRKGETSARAAFDGALNGLATYFDGRPRVLGAMADDDDTEVQASFVASRGQTVYSGLVVVQVGAADAVVGVAYDEGKAFGGDAPALMALLKKNLPAAAAAPQTPLQLTQLPDGSGTIQLPKGWNVNAVNSMVDVIGPDGQEGHFGLWTPVYTPAGAAYMNSLGVGTGVIPVCNYTDPESALKVLAGNLARAYGANWTYKQRLGAAPAPFLPGKAAYLLYDADITVNGKTVTMRTLAVIDMLPTSQAQWAFYSSSVSCPAATFDRNLPTMLAIWKSWKTDPRVFEARLKQAAEDMKAIGRIIEDVNDYRQHIMDRAVDDWDEYIRGTSQVLDRQDGTLREVPYYNLTERLNQMNQREGYERWQVIPLKDINNP
ncbi:MAG TPA: hypothetical protein VMS17_15545 [Gemmataceae bacterium]|nr:hypothetical protein [Gemmataceae bacterium]